MSDTRIAFRDNNNNLKAGYNLDYLAAFEVKHDGIILRFQGLPNEIYVKTDIKEQIEDIVRIWQNA